MNLFEQATLLQVFSNSSEGKLGKQLDLLVQSMGEKSFCQKAASHLMSMARPEDAIPRSLARFAPLVRDGIELFLSRISYSRLRTVILNQLALKDCGEPGERLLNLALHFPTLHKIGQIIARNQGLDPKLKKWLIRLEQGDYGTDPVDQAHFIRTQLAELNSPFKITLFPYIIAEASVATVLPYSWQNSDSNQTNKGVFKVLKPWIGANLQEELRILENVLSILEQNKERYALEEMKLTNLFQEIRGDLVREIDLTAEQENLAKASKIYGDVAGVRIPELAPFCTKSMTSMEYIDGIKITEIELAENQRQSLARLVFEAIICIPLFAKENLSLFHGDPHAGNLLAVAGTAPNSFDVALLDWTLAGHLSKKQRMHIMELLLMIMKCDSWSIARVIENMASGAEKKKKMDRDYLAETIKTILTSEQYIDSDPLKKAFSLLEEMTMKGVVFPSELILYRKAFFTLEGVLHDISPGFAMGEAMASYLITLLLQELPLRCGMYMDPSADRAENYRSLLSNRSLLEFSLHQNITIWQQTMQRGASMIETQVKLSRSFFMYIAGCRNGLFEK